MRRVQQVAAVLKKELALLADKAIDKNFGIVTLTGVDVQPDLKEAKAYVSCFEQNSEKEVLKILNAKANEFQHIMGRRLRMKFTPRIKFLLDRGIENVDKVERLFEEIDKKKGK